MVLDPQSFEDALRAWLPSTSTPDLTPESWSAVAIDGKSLCGTGGIDQRARMLIAAGEHQSGTVLRQQAVPKMVCTTSAT